MSSSGLHVNHALDGQRKTAEIVSILSICCTIMTVVVSLRVYTRTRITGSFGADDATVVIAQVLAIGAAVVIGLEQHYGLGRHVWTVEDIPGYMKTFYSSILVYNAALVIVKISILLMYRRIFVTKGMRWASMIGLIIVGAWGIALVTSLAMICLPIQVLWDHSVKGHCMPFVPAFFAPACINMVTDFGIFLMPLPAIKKLNLPRRQKIILAFIMCLGLLTCVISIIRLCTLDSAATSPDMTWSNTEAALWSYLELTVAMTAACLPPLRPLAGKWFPRLMHSSRSSSDAPRGRLLTWGSGGWNPLRKKEEDTTMMTTDSTVHLYAERGMRAPRMASLAGDVESGGTMPNDPAYKVSVGGRHAQGNSMVTTPQSMLSEERVGLGGNPNDAIRATTVIKQEFRQP